VQAVCFTYLEQQPDAAEKYLQEVPLNMLRLAFAFLLLSLTCPAGMHASAARPFYREPVTFSLQQQADVALALMQRRKYDEAITRLEQMLSAKPNDPEALTLLATARMYLDGDFLKAQKAFEDAFRAGGGATFFVHHSHEITKMGTDDLADYCRGWLHLRKDEVRFVPDEESAHGFKLSRQEISELKQNMMPRLFHLKAGNNNYNFQPRSKDKSEVLLIIIMYKKFIGQ
jgi:tetratricopeptide (TPR) repeat protein